MFHLTASWVLGTTFINIPVKVLVKGTSQEATEYNPLIYYRNNLNQFFKNS